MKLWHHPRTCWGHRDAKDCMPRFQSGWLFFLIQRLKPSLLDDPGSQLTVRGTWVKSCRWSLVGLHGPFPQTWDLPHGCGGRGTGFSSSQFWSLSFTLIQ